MNPEATEPQHIYHGLAWWKIEQPGQPCDHCPGEAVWASHWGTTEHEQPRIVSVCAKCACEIYLVDCSGYVAAAAPEGHD